MTASQRLVEPVAIRLCSRVVIAPLKVWILRLRGNVHTVVQSDRVNVNIREPFS